jgi:hypothetical protein
MAFTDITSRIAAILQGSHTTLTTGLRDRNLVIKECLPWPCFANQALFVWRGGISGLEYANLTGQGTGATTHGEIDGRSEWQVTVAVKYPGAEETASDQLARLAWNLLTVLRGYTVDSTNAYQGLLMTSSRHEALTNTPDGGVWALSETFTLDVVWEMSF